MYRNKAEQAEIDQLQGAILEVLDSPKTKEQVYALMPMYNKQRVGSNLRGMCDAGVLVLDGEFYQMAGGDRP